MEGGRELLGSTEQALSTDAGLITISGTVLDSSGFPIETGNVVVTLTGSAQKIVTVDPSTGQYSFSVAPGSYSVSAANTCMSFAPNVSNLNNLKANTVVNFVGSGNDVVNNCEAASQSGGTSGALTLSGHVASAGHPVVGTKVSLNGTAQGFRYTDETGAYSFSVNSGNYSLTPSGACNTYAPSVANLNGVKASKVQDFTGSGNCPPAPLGLCSSLDTDFQLASLGDVCSPTVTTTDCFDRLFTWDSDILVNIPFINSTDCRFGKFNTLLGTDPAFSQTIDQLQNFILYFFGCPFVGTEIGPLTDGLLPAPILAQGFHFTTADVQALSDDFVISIETTLASIGAPALTGAQLTAVEAQLTYLQNNLTGVVKSSTFTFSTCGDAGH